MVTFSYPARISPEVKGRGYVVAFDDLPEALTGGRNLAEARLEAADCLGGALAFRMIDKRSIPRPSKVRKGQEQVQVPLSLAPKLALYIAMQEKGVRNSDLARHMKCRETSIRRMLDPKHASRPEKLQAALQALGKRIFVRMDDAA